MYKKWQDHQDQTRSWTFLERFFWSAFPIVERSLVKLLLLFFLGLVVAQSFILSSDTNQSLVNKAARYEGVFHEEQQPAQSIFKQQD